MDEKTHLMQNLRSLRLPGIFENYETRISQAMENNLGYLDFLALVIQDERNQRDCNQIEKCIRQAGFGIEKTFECFDFSFNPSVLSKNQMNDFKTCRFLDIGMNIILVGPPGIGKTHIAKAIGHEACRHKKKVLFYNTYSLFKQLETAEKENTFDRIFKKIIKTDVLILDDFAFRKFTPNEVDLLYLLLDGRTGSKSLIVTSNRPGEDWINTFPDPVVGGAILDRMASSAQKIMVKDARSYRKEGTAIVKKNAVDI